MGDESICLPYQNYVEDCSIPRNHRPCQQWGYCTFPPENYA
jgi:hypothetical protein